MPIIDDLYNEHRNDECPYCHCVGVDMRITHGTAELFCNYCGELLHVEELDDPAEEQRVRY